MKNLVCIIDYDSGNIGSVFNLVKYLNYEVKVSNKEKDIEDASHLILPGVGSFKSTMQNLESSLELKFLKHHIQNSKKPFLGICVGMQILASVGYEFGKHKGLDLIPGEVNKINTSLSLPHIGWNSFVETKDNVLLNEIPKNADFYFIHSFVFKPLHKNHTISYNNYGEKFASIIQNENIYGVQFHPEKSQIYGQKLMRNFLSI